MFLMNECGYAIKIQPLVSSYFKHSYNLLLVDLQYSSQLFPCSIYQVYIGSQMVSEEIQRNLKLYVYYLNGLNMVWANQFVSFFVFFGNTVV